MSVATISTPLTREEALRLLQSTPTVPRLFWRTSYPNASVGLCGAHAVAWPRQLGALRLYVETPLLAQVFDDVVARMRRYAEGVTCHGCFTLRHTRDLTDPYFGLDTYGPALRSRRDDEKGLVADPDFGQTLVVDRVRVVKVTGMYDGAARWYDTRQGHTFPAYGVSQYEGEPLHGVYFVRDGGDMLELPVRFAEVVF